MHLPLAINTLMRIEISQITLYKEIFMNVNCWKYFFSSNKHSNVLSFDIQYQLIISTINIAAWHAHRSVTTKDFRSHYWLKSLREYCVLFFCSVHFVPLFHWYCWCVQTHSYVINARTIITDKSSSYCRLHRLPKLQNVRGLTHKHNHSHENTSHIGHPPTYGHNMKSLHTRHLVLVEKQKNDL